MMGWEVIRRTSRKLQMTELIHRRQASSFTCQVSKLVKEDLKNKDWAAVCLVVKISLLNLSQPGALDFIDGKKNEVSFSRAGPRFHVDMPQYMCSAP